MNVKERRDTVEGYVREFGRWTVGTRADREEARGELEAHLREADEFGRLEETIERLGSPKDAARTFAEGRGFVAAPLGRRLIAALVDYSALTGLVLLYRMSVLSQDALEPFSRIGGLIDATLSSWGPQVMLAWQAFFWGVWTAVASSAVVAALVLIVFEWRNGATPGKLLAGLRVTSEEGTTPTLFQSAVRRLPLLFWGALTLFDVAFVFRRPRRQRAFEIVAETTVVDARRTAGAQSVWNRPISQLVPTSGKAEKHERANS